MGDSQIHRRMARRAHEGIIRHVLKNRTKISLLVRAHRPAVREYRIERTIPNPPLVRDDHGEVSNLPISPWKLTWILPRISSIIPKITKIDKETFHGELWTH